MYTYLVDDNRSGTRFSTLTESLLLSVRQGWEFFDRTPSDPSFCWSLTLLMQESFPCRLVVLPRTSFGREVL